MFLPLFQSRRAADNSDSHSLIVLRLPWFGSKTTSHWGEPKASGAYGVFLSVFLPKYEIGFLLSWCRSNPQILLEVDSWLVNTCSWHWLLNEPLLQPNRDILLNRHQSPTVEEVSNRSQHSSSSKDKIKRHKESIRAILTFELDKGCGSWRWLLDQDFWSWHCNVALPDIVSLCIRDARQELKWARPLPHVNHNDHTVSVNFIMNLNIKTFWTQVVRCNPGMTSLQVFKF